MAFDAFMYLNTPPGGTAVPVVGETLDPEFKPNKAFELKSFKIEVKNPTSMGSAGGGAGTGKCSLEPFEVTKVTDNCSPALFLTCATGSHYALGVLSVRKAGGAKTGDKYKSGATYLRYTFKCCFVNSVSWSGSSGDDLPEETVQFAYGAVTIEYYPQTAQGTLSTTANTGTWNQVTNDTSAEVPSPGS